MNRYVWFVLLALLTRAVAADSIPVSHWTRDLSIHPSTREEWLSACPIDTAARPGSAGDYYSDGDSGTAVLYVDASLWTQLDTAITRFSFDLVADGYSVKIETASSSVPCEWIRASLQAVWDSTSHGLIGALLIGDIQPAWFQVPHDGAPCYGYAEWPCDMFYMDMDGDWRDTLDYKVNGDTENPLAGRDGRYDTLMPDGHAGPEIFVSRLLPIADGLDPVALLRNYFRKDSAYRAGALDLPQRALNFLDDEWNFFHFEDDAAVAFPDTENFLDPDTTRASAYGGVLQTPRTWVTLAAHSDPFSHEFAYNSGHDTDRYNARFYINDDPPVSFYDFNACSFSRFSSIWGNGGGWAIFNHSYGLASLGAAKKMWPGGKAKMYEELASGHTIGSAVLSWLASLTEGHVNPDVYPYCYGYVLQGDPFLRPVRRPVHDVSVAHRIYAPCGEYVGSQAVVPRVKVRNCGDVSEAFPVVFTLTAQNGTPFYYDSLMVEDLAPDSETEVTFDTVYLIADSFSAKAKTILQGDEARANDSILDWVLVKPVGWNQRADLPPGARSKSVRDGGCLAADDDFVYALKGNGTNEFYGYNISSNEWSLRESLPAFDRSSRRTRVKKGAALARNGNGWLHAAEGGNRRNWWRRNWGWSQGPDVPGSRAVKEGCGVAGVTIAGSYYVYVLKGSGTFEFYRYRVADSTWETKAPAPAGTSGKSFKSGSCLAYDGGDIIYALKGHYNEFFAYSISGNTWETRETLPGAYFPGSPKKRARDGAALTCLGGRVYALKGGNTNEFWSYDCATHQWSTCSAMPNSSRMVKGGGALATAAGQVWAFRGNNTREFWTCFPPIPAETQSGTPPSSPGANEVQIAACANATAETPCWSPDGVWVAFCRSDQNQDVQLFKAPASGGQVTALTSVSGSCSAPTWSSDGSAIAFEYESNTGQFRQIAIVSSGGGQVTELTSDACDHENPVWDLAGNGLLYSRLDATAYTQVYHVSSSGGSEQAISSTSYAHEKPQVLSNTEVICERDGDDVYTGVYKLNVNTGQEVELTSGTADYSGCCVAAGARLCAAEKTDQDGFSQIVVFSADGGTENVITSGNYDYSVPSICSDGSVLSCLREGNSGSAVCVYDLVEGTCHVLTDALADREAPDVQVVNSAQHLVSTSYIREDDVYKVDYLSSSGLVIAPNGFRAGIARDPDGYVHSVYSDGALIRHEVRDQNGTCIRQDTPGYGDSPSLSMSIAGDAVVVSRKGDSIFGSIQRPNNSWRRVLLYTAPTCHHVGPPASAAFQVASGRFVNTCLPCYDSTSGSSMILFVSADTLGNVVLDTLDLCSGSYSDSSVCMAVNDAYNRIEVSYQRFDSVYQRFVDFAPTDSTRPDTWTTASKVNDSATTGRSPTCERRNGRFYVAFSESWIDSASSNPVWSIVRASCCDTVPTVTWEGRGPVSSVDQTRKDCPSLSLTQTAWAESSSTTNHWLIKANIADSQVTLSPDTSCVSCALLCDSTVLARPATAMTRLRLVWLQKYGSSGDTWQVPVTEREIYAASADANVTRYNQGRKLCLDSTGSSTDSIRVVFRSDAASLRVASKRDGDETWTSSLLRNSGDMPAIDQSQGRIWVCDRDVSTVPPGNVIRCQNRAIGSSNWHDFQVYFTANPNPANPRLGPPAIVASLNDTSGQNRGAAYIIFTAYTPSPPKSAVVICKVDTGGNILWTDTLHSVSSLTDSFADVAAHPVAGQGGSSRFCVGDLGSFA